MDDNKGSVSDKDYSIENESKIKPKNRIRKRKRSNSNSSTDLDDVLPENTLEIEKSLHASAIKNNLDDISVKKILKAGKVDYTPPDEVLDQVASILGTICDRYNVLFRDDGSKPIVCLPNIAFVSATDGSNTDNIIQLDKSITPKRKQLVKMLKVVTNDHVLAFVKLREEEEGSQTENGLHPKLTRSKVKELLKVSPNSAPWNAIELTPIKGIPVKTRPEVKALIAQELPDDEDDDEYEPIHDESDDDRAPESCSDLESQPRTPATPRPQTTAAEVVQDGPFKVPQNIASVALKKSEEEEATIALRTRSKLSLSATPIEHIESCFEPPDALPSPAVDGLWSSFLEGCLNPFSHTRPEDEDDDPEYSVAADPDAHEDDEALETSILTISKKELNDLVTELFDVLPPNAEEQLANGFGLLGEGNGDMMKTLWEGKREPISDEEINLSMASKVEKQDGISIGKMESEDIDQMITENVLTKSTEMQTSYTSVVSTPSAPLSSTVQISVVEHRSSVASPASPLLRPPALRELQEKNKPPSTLHVTVDPDMQIHAEQILILQQQLRQHVQLATTYYLQLLVHPVHWSYAPKYKEYLESLEKLILSNPNSVANICNLKPALDLVKGWEESVSESTPENVKMVEFIQKEVEKSRKRISQNSMYLGDFPELFKRVVANSSVFLYPYLLPPSPCRADAPTKRYGYFKSEDELIVLGLKQFSEYVEANPSIFKKPRINPRKRWSLTTATELTCKYMFPWMNVRSLLGHLHLVKRNGEKNNPIVKFFEENIIVPVKHKLLPFNPSLTLYEQPEFEMPRIWIRYLAKSSKRFKDSLHRKPQTTIQPSGVDVTADILEPQQKKPLPIDFIKTIPCDRNNLLQKTTPVLVNKVDVHIKTQEQPVIVAANIYTLIQTSSGAQLLPIQVKTSTVDSATTPICTPISTPTCTPIVFSGVSDTTVDGVMQNEVNTEEISKPNNIPDHCACCVLLRKICKTRQSLITEYFKSNQKIDRSCGCRKRKYPNITNKLKLLVNNYKGTSFSTHGNLINRIRACKSGRDNLEDENYLNFNDKDFVDALKFQVKLIQRTNIARDNKIKIRVNNLLSNFDCEDGDPLLLIDSLYKIFDIELADMYSEFITFLTPLQADEINRFKEYFTRSCLKDLILKIEEQVKDNSIRSVILSQIQADIYKNMPACEMCCRLLEHMENYPKLASYTFDLFPHLWREENGENCPNFSQQNVTNVNRAISKNNAINPMSSQILLNQIPRHLNDTVPTCDETINTIDYEADGSSSSEEETEVTVVENDTSNNNEDRQEDIKIVTTIKYEVETPELSITKTEIQENSSDISMLIMSDDESVKSEPSDWNRDEDKLILQVLKQFLTPEQIKDKTIIEVIEENLLVMIADNLIHKSLDDVRERVLYLLQVLGNDI